MPKIRSPEPLLPLTQVVKDAQLAKVAALARQAKVLRDDIDQLRARARKESIDEQVFQHRTAEVRQLWFQNRMSSRQAKLAAKMVELEIAKASAKRAVGRHSVLERIAKRQKRRAQRLEQRRQTS